MFTANIQFAGVDEITKDLQALAREIDPVLKRFANKTAKQMKSYIKPRRTPSTGNLARSIKVYKKREGKGIVSYAVGDPSEMPIYWYVVNYGGYTPPASRGYFGNGSRPRGGVMNQRFTHVASNKYSYIKPNKPIRPMRFIEKTEAWALRNFDRELRVLTEVKK